MKTAIKQNWRPFTAWAFIIGWCATLTTALGLLWLGKVELQDASNLLIALVAGGSAPVTTYTYQRTREKVTGVADDYPPPPGFAE